MIYDRDNRNDFLFSALIIGICLWAFSSISTESFSNSLRSENQNVHILSISADQADEFITPASTLPFNNNCLISDNFESKLSNTENIYSMVLSILLDIKFKSCNHKSQNIKPEISKTSMDYILSSNMGVEYQSIS